MEENDQESTNIRISDSGTLPIQLNYSGSSLSIDDNGITLNETKMGFYGSGVTESYTALTITFWSNISFNVNKDRVELINYGGSSASTNIICATIVRYLTVNLEVWLNGNIAVTLPDAQGYHHWAISYDGLSVYVYQDTILSDTITGITGASSFSTTTPINVAYMPAKNNINTYAIVDDIRMYNYKLTQEEIENIYYLGLENTIT